MSIKIPGRENNFDDGFVSAFRKAKEEASNKAKSILNTGKGLANGTIKETSVIQNVADTSVDTAVSVVENKKSSQPKQLKRSLSKLVSEDNYHNWAEYPEESKNIKIPRGVKEEDWKEFINTDVRGQFKGSLVNKIHLIRVSGVPASDKDEFYRMNQQAKKFSDLCQPGKFGVIQYDPDDFLYCKYLGMPLNRMITLRRFPYAVTDNIYDTFNQSHPDMARMVTFFTDEVNKLDELLSVSFGLRWKELNAETETVQIGGTNGITSGSWLARILPYIDPVAAKDRLRGEEAREYNPLHDQNKVYGPVDSINKTHIRDIGFDLDKEFSIVFEYELRSYGGRTPEYVMRDIIANALAVTFNNGHFWGGARIWTGHRPTQYLKTFQGILNPEKLDGYISKAREGLKGVLADLFGNHGGSKIQALKNALGSVLKNAAMVGLGEILDKVGRAAIPQINSLLSGEPVGNWHLTIGHPEDPIMCIGNLMCKNVEIKFPTDELSFGNFPTKLEITVKLEPAMPKDRAGLETIYNRGRERIYQNPKRVKVFKSKANQLDPARRTKRVYNPTLDNNMIQQTFDETYDFRDVEFIDKKNKKGIMSTHMEVSIDDDDLKYTLKEPDFDTIIAQSGYKTDKDSLAAFEAKQAAAQQSSYTPSGGASYGGAFTSGINYPPDYKIGGKLVDRDNVKGNSGISQEKLNQVAANATANCRPNSTRYSKGRCARAVNDAFAEAGLEGKFGRGHAFQKRNMLKSQGWAELPADTKPKIGDVIVISNGPPLTGASREYGHVAVWNGKAWVSDFDQTHTGPNVYKKYLNDPAFMNKAVIMRP